MSHPPVQLPANRGFPFRRAYYVPTWNVRLGVVQIEESKSPAFHSPTVSRYAVVEADCPDGGWLFRLVKSGGAEFYWVRVKPNETSCDCTGFLQYGYCKHAESLTALIARGRLKPVLGDLAGVRAG